MNSAPLFFHHIPKTGGTSLIGLLHALTPPGDFFTGPGNALSESHTAQFAGAGLPPGAVIAGHPGWGACRPWRNAARFITLLRAPEQQLISHYLHALRDPSLPQHAAAKALGLQQFLRVYPYNIAFQTNALYLGIADPAVEFDRALQDPDYGSAFHLDRFFARQLPEVFTYLEEMALVGTLERFADFVSALAALADWPIMPPLPHDNAAAPAERVQAAELLEQLMELEAELALAPLFAIERATYAKAQSLGRPCLPEPVGLIAHSSGIGEITLAQNFAPASPDPGWWTGRAQVSHFAVTFRHSAPCRLQLRADLLHGVQPDEIMLRAGDVWLELRSASMPNGTIELTTTVTPAAGEAQRFHLYLQWNRYPGEPPFYPAVRFSAFSLSPALAAA